MQDIYDQISDEDEEDDEIPTKSDAIQSDNPFAKDLSPPKNDDPNVSAKITT